jgi:hypothetical protein
MRILASSAACVVSRFAVNSDKLYDSPQNDEIINDLIKNLKEYPQLQLFIVGNAGTDKPGGVKPMEAVRRH